MPRTTYKIPKDKGTRGMDLVKSIHKETGIDTVIIQTVIDSFLRSIMDTVLGGKSIRIYDLGTFYPKLKSKRRNHKFQKRDQRNEDYYFVTPPHFIPAFKAGTNFQKAVRETLSSKENK